MTPKDEPDFLKEFDEFLENIDKPKPKAPKLRLVSEASPKVDLEAKRQRNREREEETLAEERRQADEAHQRSVEFCQRRGIPPPPGPADAAQLRRDRLAEQALARRQQILHYHGEMRSFHEAAEREFRENDILRLWS